MLNTAPTHYKPHRFIHIYLQLGKLLFLNGATVQRVIDSIGAMKNYLGGDDLQVMIDYDGLVITDINGQHYHTRVERRNTFVVFNIEVLIEVSKLIRNLAVERPTVMAIKATSG
jgi:uncharacterized membrane protein YjjP (DUF1212 family)